MLCKRLILARDMANSFNYPIFLSLRDKKCLIVGFGKVGQRKLEYLLSCSPLSALVLDLKPKEALPDNAKRLLSYPFVSYENRSWNEDDVLSTFLVFACTNDSKQNAELCRICQVHNRLCNNVTDPGHGDFTVPAITACASLRVAVSTNGASPLLAAKLREEIKVLLKDRADIVRFMEKVREKIIYDGRSQLEHKKMFETLLSPPLVLFLQNREKGKCVEWMNKNLDESCRQLAIQSLEEIWT